MWRPDSSNERDQKNRQIKKKRGRSLPQDRRGEQCSKGRSNWPLHTAAANCITSHTFPFFFSHHLSPFNTPSLLLLSLLLLLSHPLVSLSGSLPSRDRAQRGTATPSMLNMMVIAFCLAPGS